MMLKSQGKTITKLLGVLREAAIDAESAFGEMETLLEKGGNLGNHANCVLETFTEHLRNLNTMSISARAFRDQMGDNDE